MMSIPRRSLLITALGLGAAGALAARPALAFATAEERVAYHFRELERAMRELHPHANIVATDNALTPQDVLEHPRFAHNLMIYAMAK
jgi:hypothetical protein